MNPEGDLSPGLPSQIGNDQKIPMIILSMDCLVNMINLDLDAQFFFDFPNEALLRGFPVFQLAAWELPLARQGSVSALTEQYLVTALNYSCNYRQWHLSDLQTSQPACT